MGSVKGAFTGAGPHLTHSYALNRPVTVTNPTGHPDPANHTEGTQRKQIFEEKDQIKRLKYHLRQPCTPMASLVTLSDLTPGNTMNASSRGMASNQPSSPKSSPVSEAGEAGIGLGALSPSSLALELSHRSKLSPVPSTG